MSRAYRYIFFRLYHWASQLHDDGDSPAYTALWTASLLVFANLLSVSMLLGIVAPSSTIDRVEGAKWIGVAAFLAVAGLHFHFFVREDSIEGVVAEFEVDDPMHPDRGNRIYWTYVLGSISVFVALVLAIAVWRSY